MKINKIMRQYYEAELDNIKPAAHPTDILKAEPTGFKQQKKFSLENAFGCLVTAGYLLSVFTPESWFSFGKFLFSFRLGFLF